ncbi:MAG: RDD family protein [Candidatus Nanopelagicales bacterium]
MTTPGSAPVHGRHRAPRGASVGAGADAGTATPGPSGGAAVLAGLLPRFLSAVLDLALVLAVGVGLALLVTVPLLGRNPTVDPSTGAIFVGSPLGTALVEALTVGVVAAAYSWGFVGLSGRTPGRRLLRVRVVRGSDGVRPGLGRAVLRWLPVGGVWLLAWGLGWYVPYVGTALLLAALAAVTSPVWDRRGRLRGWPDRLAGTLVLADT